MPRPVVVVLVESHLGRIRALKRRLGESASPEGLIGSSEGRARRPHAANYRKNTLSCRKNALNTVIQRLHFCADAYRSIHDSSLCVVITSTRSDPTIRSRG